MNIKTVLSTLLIAVLIVTSSCSDRNNKSDAYGTFEATEIIVSSEAMGKILQFNIEEGQKLKAGEYVGLIDTTDLSLNKAQLLARKKAVLSKLDNISTQISVHEQQKENLITDRNRINSLMKDGAATQKQFDDIEGGIKVAEKQISAVRSQKQGIVEESNTIDAQIAQINENIRKCHLVNPESGTVLTKYVEENEITAFGKPLYKIARLDIMELKVYVSGSQLPEIRIGDEVEVLIDEDKKANRKLSGRISWISSNAEFTPKTIQTKEERVNLVYAVKVRVENDGSLKIGMPGEVNFQNAAN